MKLNELLGVKAHREKDLLGVLADISGEGSKFKPAGSGIAARVFVHNDGIVYKFWAKDSEYEKFIDFVASNQDDKHLPKLKSKVKELTTFFKHPEKFPKKIKYVKLEQLTPTRYEDQFPGAKIYTLDVLNAIEAELKSGKKDVKNVIEELSEDEGSWLKPQSVALVKSLFLTVEKILKAFPEKKALDLHSGNVMKRGDEIVLIDPVAGKDDIVFNKELRLQIRELSKALKDETDRTD